MQRFEDINFGSGDDILSSVTASIDKNSDPAVLDPTVRLIKHFLRQKTNDILVRYSGIYFIYFYF